MMSGDEVVGNTSEGKEPVIMLTNAIYLFGPNTLASDNGVVFAALISSTLLPCPPSLLKP